MLTDIQIEKLNNLRDKYPEYNHLIDRMIEGWKVTKPNPRSYGIDWFDYSNNKLRPTEDNCTCLLGACMIGLEVEGQQGDRFDNAIEQLNVVNERRYITNGFDDAFWENKPDSFDWQDEPAYQFAQEVRKIVL